MRSLLVQKYFPLPEFVVPPRFGISFSDTNIKAVAVEGSELKSVVIPLEPSIIKEGKVANPPELIRKLQSLQDLFNSKLVFFTLPDELVYVYEVSLLVGQGGNMNEKVAFTIEENVPLSLADTIFDFKPVTIEKSEHDYKSRTVVAASLKSEVEKFVGCLREAGLEPLGCVHESQAIAQAVVPHRAFGSYGIVHARKERIGIYLVKNRVVNFSTYQSVSPVGYLDQFLSEYQKFLEYIDHYEDAANNSIKEILVCGEFEYAKKVLTVINSDQGKGAVAKLANVWTNLLRIEDHTPNINYEESLLLAGPVGAVLSELI